MSRVYCGRLPYRANERDIERFFQGYGKIYEILLKNGYAFVEFSEPRDADDACHDLNGRTMMGSSVICEVARGTPRGGDRYRFKNEYSPPPRRGRRSRSRSRDRYGGGGSSSKTEYRLIVENLSSRVSWQDLKDFFRKVGEVTYADAHGKKKGEGLVEFSNKSDMKAALDKMDGKDLEGRKIRLTPEKKRKRSRSRSRTKSKSRSVSPPLKKSKDRVTKDKEDTEKDVNEMENGDKKEKREKKRSESRSPSPPPKKNTQENGDRKKAKVESGSDSD